MAILAFWEAAYRVIGWSPGIFPAPAEVLAALGRLAHGWQSPLLTALWVSAIRLGIGYVLTGAIGILLGVAMWRWIEFDRLVGPLFLGLQALPSVCWVPLAILLPFLGATERGVIFVTVMGSTWAVALALRDGLRAVPTIYHRSGLMLGARGLRLYVHVLLPSSLPALVASLRLGFSFAWRSLMGAEILFKAVLPGLGYLLKGGQSDAAQVVGIMIIMVLIGMLADRWVFAKLQARVQSRFGLA
jgi:NitT/TauT family transport system permease protein